MHGTRWDTCVTAATGRVKLPSLTEVRGVTHSPCRAEDCAAQLTGGVFMLSSLVIRSVNPGRREFPPTKMVLP